MGVSKIFTRSSLLTVLLLAGIGLVGSESYWFWKGGPWDLPTPVKAKSVAPVDDETPDVKSFPIIGTESIINKNLFDPERGEGRNREAEANSRAVQRIRGMVLLGTAVLGNSRYAVLRDQGTSAVPGQLPQAQLQNFIRLKLGDDVEGFRLSDIADKRVVFTKGATRVEVALDYFRKADTPVTVRRVEPRVPGAPIPRQTVPVVPSPPVRPVPVPGQVVAPPPQPVTPQVVPNLPRRERVPVPRRNQSLMED